MASTRRTSRWTCIMLAMVVPACLAFAAPAAGAISFTSPASESFAGNGPLAVAAGDFNGDSNRDVVVSGVVSGNGSVALMLGNGSGGLGDPAGIWPMSPGGTGDSTSIVAADFNDDTFLDFAATNRTSNDVSVFLGNGAGGVLAEDPGVVPASPTRYGVNGQPFDIATGDFDGDDVADLVTADQTTNTVSVLRGDGDGTFTLDSSPATGGTRPRGVAVGDLDDDGDQDIVAANSGSDTPGAGDDTVAVLLRNAGGGFASAVTYAVGDRPRRVALGDVDEDGDLDIATANSASASDFSCPCADSVTVLLGAGDGTFTEADGSPFSTGSDTAPYAIAAADFDGDGDDDLATGNRIGASAGDGEEGFSVLEADGSGVFGSPQFIALTFGGGGVVGLAAADMTNDSRLDLIGPATQNPVFVSRNTTPIAVDDSATVAEDSGVTPIDVLANDPGGTTVASVDQSGTHGSVDITGGTGVDYTPDPGYCNDGPGTDLPPDTFTYTINGGSTATVSATVTCDAAPDTYYVRTPPEGSGDACTLANPCDTVEAALTAHRVSPQPGDVIDVGPGTFVGNFAADDPDDDGLTIRGTLDGETRQTTLRGEVFGAGDTFTAFHLGVTAGCGPAEVDLRNANVDVDGADPNVVALELDGGSDLFNVQATNQPASTAGQVMLVCDLGTTIERSEIAAPAQDSAIAVADAVRLVDSTVTAETEGAPAVLQFSGDPDVQLRIRRSVVSTAEASISPAVFSTSRLAVDSSLITGGVAGVQTFDGVEWLVNNSTIDAGHAGVSDPVNTPSLFLDPSSGSADVTVDSSILVDGVEASGAGNAVCTNSDLPSTEQSGTFVIDCPTGAGTTNTTTDPAELFAAGSPYDWRLAPDSPAIDTGAPGPPPAGLATRDLAGNPRRAAGTTATCPDGIRDKGAYEFVGPPCNVSLPEVLNGETPEPGSKLSSFRGEWSDMPTGYARLWLRCDADGDNCAEIAPPRTNKGYTVRGPDVGHTLRVQVIASNAAGDSEPALSDPSGVVSAP